MSGIVSGVGLISGLPIADLIDQLIQVESGPYRQVVARVEQIKIKRTSYATLNAQLLALKSVISRLDEVSFFRKSKTISSNEAVVSATAAEQAVPGSYTFRVRSLVTSHQLISAGLPDVDHTAIGAGTISFEVGHGKINPPTPLDELNGGAGVRRGRIEIQDRAGHTAQIDLTSALTVEDVLAAINNDSRIDVRATVSGDRLVLTDLSGGSATNLTVQDIAGGATALDLGIRQSVAAETLTGLDIRNVSLNTRLSLLNDGNGVRRAPAGADLVFTDEAATLFGVELNDTLKLSTHLQQLNDGNGVQLGQMSITSQSGGQFTVDLAAPFDFGAGPRSVQTIGDVITVINQAAASAGVNVTAQLEPGTQLLQLADNTTGSGTFQVTDVTGSAANDLGLNGDAVSGKITSPKILHIASLGDVVRAINFAEGNYDLLTGTRQITASVSNNGLQLSRADGATFAVQAGGDSAAAEDLGLLTTGPVAVLNSRPLIAGLNTVLLRSLNGGDGVSTLDGLAIQTKAGLQLNVDLTGAQTVRDVIESINAQSQAAGAGVSAEVNAAGNGIVLTDESGGGGTLSVTDNQTSRDLGLGGASTSGAQLAGGNLQLQYVSEATLLSTFKQGAGLGNGKLRITNSAGQSFTVSITENQKTVGDVITQINNAGASLGIVGEVNSTGDGLLITDTSGGAGKLRVEDAEGAVGAGLNLLRDSTTQETSQIIDGTFEFRIVVDADDTLNDVAQKINSAGDGAFATVINDGGAANSFRLSITSATTGSAGELTLDAGTTGLAMSDLVRPQDAVVLFGGSGSASPLVIRSASNTLTNVVQNVTLNLLSTSTDDVTITVSRDVDGVVESIQTFVDAYNNLIDRIDDLTFFDSETLKSGVLRGEGTVSTIQTRLRAVINAGVPTDEATIGRLSAVGVRFGVGGKLEFDEAKFKTTFTEEPQAVEELFTLSELIPEVDAAGNPVLDPETGEAVENFVGRGIGFKLNEALDQLTRTFDGVMALKDRTLESQEELLSDRAEFLLSLLNSHRSRLEAQFAGLEQALSALSGQQSALSLLASGALLGQRRV